jgi:hypothetical protein
LAVSSKQNESSNPEDAKMRASVITTILIGALAMPVLANAGPVRATANATTTAVTATGKAAVKGTAVVGRTAVRGSAAVARTGARGVACVATLFHRCGRPPY